MCSGVCKHKTEWSIVFPQIPGLYWFWGQFNYSNAHDNPRVIPKMHLIRIVFINGLMTAIAGDGTQFSHQKWSKGVSGFGWVGKWQNCKSPTPPSESSTRSLFEP